MISLSDDSGLEVSALNNRPGIFSARWAKKYGNFYKAMKVILSKLSKSKNRKAKFICSLSIKINEKKNYNCNWKSKWKNFKKYYWQ